MPQGELMKSAVAGPGHPPRRPVSRDLESNVDYVNRKMGVGISYEVIFRQMRIGDVPVASYIINGFFQTFTNIQILTDAELRHGEAPHPESEAPENGKQERLSEKTRRVLRSLLDYRLAFAQVTLCWDLDEAILQVMSGPMVMFIDGEDAAIIVDTRDYPDRTPSQPVVEQLVRGPRDGFVENVITNTALIRRRVRDPGLRFELVKVGVRSQTDVAVGYIEGLTDPHLVHKIKDRLLHTDIDGIPTASEAVAEILGDAPWNPMPTVRMTERPDVAAINLFDGHVLVVVDTSPEVIVAPVTLPQLLQHPEDYQVNPVMGTYLRWIEFIAFFGALLVPPLWLLLATHTGIRSHFPFLSFIGAKKPTGLPLALQFTLAEISIDVLRRSILNSPSALASTFGILGAVVLGSVATKAGIFTPEALVYVTFAALSSFAISYVELGMVSRLIRLSLILLEWIWALPGIVIGVLFWSMLIVRTDSIGVPYLWPLLPFNWSALRTILVRGPVTGRAPRPVILHPRDRLRGGNVA